MKTFRQLILFYFLAFAVGTYAQSVHFTSKTKNLVLKVQNLNKLKSTSTQTTAELKNFYQVRTIKDQSYVGALIQVYPEIDQKALESLGVIISSKITNIWSVLIPLSALEKLGEIRGLKYVDVNVTAHQKLDVATAMTKVNEVHAGTGLARKYNGDSVVIGIIDGGFDLTHPNFYDISGKNLRIRSAWDQADTTGLPPDGFKVGTEYVGQSALLGKKHLADNDSHGTHVAGIAAGSGYLNPGNKYMGAAPAAFLIFVEAPVADGIKYIFKKAAELGKPAVVNLSLGSHIGPHDGTSLLDQVIDSLVGPGKIVVGAAGNEGDKHLHIKKTLNNDTLRTFVGLNEDKYYLNGKVDLWGSPKSDFAVSILISDTTSNKKVVSTPFFYASNKPAKEDTMFFNGDTLAFNIVGVEKDPFNQKPNLFVEIGKLSKKYLATLVVTSTNSTVDAWNDGHMFFIGFNGDEVPGYTMGDNNSTVGEIGGTAKKIITVGSYVSKNEWTDLKNNIQTSDGKIQTLVSSSSRGPTADGRTKPEITAPGEMIASSVNSFDAVYGEDNKYTVLKAEMNNRKYYYAISSGTSMAAPMVTGIIALMLQANPLLGPERVKEIIQQNAVNDSYTGLIGPEGNNNWGRGKVDALKSVEAAYKVLGMEEERHSSDIAAYPNPSSGIIYLAKKGTNGTNAEIIVRNMIGRTVFHQTNTQTGSEPYRIDLSALPAGMYIITVKENIHPQRHIKISLTR
jgi:subtilisin family serine protease